MDTSPSYGRCFLSLTAGLAPIFLILGIAAVFGSNTVTWNNGNVYGLAGLLVAILLNIVFAAFLAGLQKLGYWFLSLVKHAPVEV